MTQWRDAEFRSVVTSRGSGASGLPQSEWKEQGRYPVIGQGAEYVEGWTDRVDLLVTPAPAVVLYGGHTRRAKYVDSPFVPGPNVKILEPSDEIDAKYLFHFLSQLRVENRGYADHFPEVRRQSVPVPPLVEQRRIAAILDQADALRAKRREALAQLDSLTQSIFFEMFGADQAKLMTIGHLLETGALLLHKDGNHGSQYPSADEFGEFGVPFLSAKSVNDEGAIDNEQVQRLRTEKAQELRIGWIEQGDVLLAHNASVGKVALYDGRFESALIGTSLTAYRPNPARLDSRFLAGALKSRFFQLQLEKNMGQTTRNQVPITAQRSLTLPLPDIVVQREFAKKVEQVEQQRRLNQAASQELEAMFVSLQVRAFPGEL